MCRRCARRGFVVGIATLFSGCLGGSGGDRDCRGAPVNGAGKDYSDGDRGNETDDDTTNNDDTTDETEADDGETEDDETEAPDEELDLREANVMAVTFSQEGEGTHTFDVTLYHDDDGEDGYANWWQVESLEGDCLGRRVLTHSHGTRRFTRSETVETGDETCVVVRGHDQTHGYGGRTVVVNLETAETRGVVQGEEPSSFDGSDCP